MRGTAVSRRQVSPIVATYVHLESAWIAGRHHLGAIRLARARDDRGEGVISAAIVVLIMAALGAAMWVAFNGMWKGIQDRTEHQVEDIGGNGGGGG
jgi:hypothetical protein